MDCLESREPTAYKAALKCLANLMSGEGDEVARWAIQGGLLPRAAEILSQGLVKDKKTMLWTLSNIAGSPDAELRQSVLEETLLMQQVVQLMSSASSEEISGAAAWVVTNLLTCGGAGDYQRGRFVQEMGSELIMQLVSLLKELPNQPAIQFEVLTAVARLLELDAAHPSEFSGENSVVYLFECAQGFDVLDFFADDPNEALKELATEILTTYSGEGFADMDREFGTTEDEPANSLSTGEGGPAAA